MFKRIADEPLATPEYRKNQETMLRQVMQYCHNDIECRRSQVLLHFGEIFDPQECRNQCDNCCCNQVVVEKDMTELAMDAVRFVKSLPATQPMPKTKFLMAAWGSQANLMAGPQGKGLSRVEKERLVDRLLSLGIFEQVGYDTGSGYPAHKLSVRISFSSRPWCYFVDLESLTGD